MAHKCNSCLEDFPTKQSLGGHRGSKHRNPEAKFPCKKCGTVFNSKQALGGHTKSSKHHRRYRLSKQRRNQTNESTTPLVREPAPYSASHEEVVDRIKHYPLVDMNRKYGQNIQNIPQSPDNGINTIIEFSIGGAVGFGVGILTMHIMRSRESAKNQERTANGQQRTSTPNQYFHTTPSKPNWHGSILH